MLQLTTCSNMPRPSQFLPRLNQSLCHRSKGINQLDFEPPFPLLVVDRICPPQETEPNPVPIFRPHKTAAFPLTLVKMKSLCLVFIAVATCASAAPSLEHFVASAKSADSMELCWGADFPIEKIGVTRVKRRYMNKDRIDSAISHLKIDLTKRAVSGVDKDGNPWFDAEALGCQHEHHFTHRLRAFKQGQCIAELWISLDGRRVALIDKGEKIPITDDTLEWLQEEADWKHDLGEILKSEEKVKTNQKPENKTDATSFSTSTPRPGVTHP